MKKIFVGIPVLNRLDLLQASVASIDVPARVFVVNNNVVDKQFNDELTAWALANDVEVRSSPYNLGVAASWNLIITTAMGWGYEEIFIGSNDTTVLPGTLAAIRDLDKSDPDDAIWHICGWNYWAIHARTIARVGLFDENFYPAYREDQDYSYRCDYLANMKRYAVPKHPMPPLANSAVPATVGGHHLGSQTVASNAQYAAHNRNTHGNWNTTHYKMKWGGMPLQETFKVPYGKVDKDHRWWPDPGNSIAVRDWDKHEDKIRGI